MLPQFQSLQNEADQYIASASTNDWNRPILSRIADMMAIMVAPTKLRVRGAQLTIVEPQRIEVKLTGLSVVTLIIAPAEQLAAEVFVFKMAATRHLAMAHIVGADLSYATLPVAYVMITYVAGGLLSDVADETLQRIAARQFGRSMRTLHTIEAPGYGSPNPSGQWPTAGWQIALQNWFLRTLGTEFVRGVLGRTLVQDFFAAVIPHDHADIAPMCLHGDIAPQHVRVTVHSHIQLEAVVRSGMLVGGDPMFDVAAPMRQQISGAFRQGFIEGYTLNTPLTDAERERIRRYTLLWRVHALLERLSPHDEEAIQACARTVTQAVHQLGSSRPNERPR